MLLLFHRIFDRIVPSRVLVLQLSLSVSLCVYGEPNLYILCVWLIVVCIIILHEREIPIIVFSILPMFVWSVYVCAVDASGPSPFPRPVSCCFSSCVWLCVVDCCCCVFRRVVWYFISSNSFEPFLCDVLWHAFIPIDTTRRIAPLLRHRRSSLVNGWLMMLMWWMLTWQWRCKL